MEVYEKLGLTKKQYEEVQYQAKLELARRDFWYFCCLLAPDFYMEGRSYLKNICRELQDFYEDKDARVMIINEPPRHGKSRTAGLFAQWIFGKTPSEKIITGSYNEQLSTTFSRGVRDAIQERKASKDRIVYSDIFPSTRLKRGSGAANLWTLEGQHISYLATSPGGTVTGFGASLMIIDDIVKNAEEALNEVVLENHWTWFTNTMLSRLEKGGKVIIIATRWNTKDLSGRAIDHYKSIGVPIKLITEKALQSDGTMLCDGVLDRAAYDLIVKTMGREIVEANYNQNPIDLVGRLYNLGFQTYKQLPVDENGQSVVEEVCAYIDTADQGDDFLCCIIYGLYRQQAYVLDVYFTKEGMEITEGEVAKRLYEHQVNKAYIESNNGGRGFGRSVERILREKHHYYKCYIDLFTQSRNKKARILSSATWCQNNIKFPIGWEINYADFYGEYRMLSSSLRVLSSVTEKDAKAKGCIKLRLPDISNATAGLTPEFSSIRDDGYIYEICKALEESPLAERAGSLDVSDKYNIVLTVDSKYIIRFGDSESFETKLKIANAVLKDDMFKKDIKATIDVTKLSETSVVVDEGLKID